MARFLGYCLIFLCLKFQYTYSQLTSSKYTAGGGFTGKRMLDAEPSYEVSGLLILTYSVLLALDLYI